MFPTIAEVVFNLPLERTFHYLISADLYDKLKPGMRVLAPFGGRELLGFAIYVGTESPLPLNRLKTIRRVVDAHPVIDGERWELARWMSGYYLCTLGEALAAMVPAALRQPKVQREEAFSQKPPAAKIPVLTAHQRQAFGVIQEALDKKAASACLLHGVTGSGKTELYLRAIENVLARGQSAICLIPEIALTPQMTDRFFERLGSQVAVWHSRLTAKQRSVQWEKLATGVCRVVVGARSAVFAPVKHLGLIVIDEEQEQAYKQDNVPRYHARTIARHRAQLTGALLLLGSATPSVESYFAASEGKDQLLVLPERVRERTLPKVEIVDMREEMFRSRRAGPFSMRLMQALEQAIVRKEQVILMLNRRGFARVAQCQGCGWVGRCPSCSVPLIFHADSQKLICHYCSESRELADICPACHKGYVKLRGAGTERVESELHRLFPASVIARMDRDTTRARDSHQRFYEEVKTGQIGLLVGTQMVAKGHDFPRVTLVGIISADTALNLPDFRAGEWTFDLLTQAAGRAGRGEVPGVVVIQTYCPSHYAIQAARSHDYQKFYEEELKQRRQLSLPPFAHLIKLTVSAGNRQRAVEAADRLAGKLSRAQKDSFDLLGPSFHRIPRLRGRYRMCLLMKGKSVEPMVESLRKVLQSGRRFEGLAVAVDVDPL